MFWTERTANELYVFHNGMLIYKRWDKPKNSIIINKVWPNEWIV